MRRVFLGSLTFCCALFLVGAGASLAAPTAHTRIQASPPYTADQLSAPAGDNWISNMGSLNGNRYSSLTQINSGNGANLKLAWRINLGTCIAKDATCGSLEANAVVADGIYYIQTPKSDVFAL